MSSTSQSSDDYSQRAESDITSESVHVASNMCPKINRVQPSNNHPRALEEQSNNNTSSTQSQNVLSCNESLNEVELPKLRVAERDLGKIYTSLKPQIKECEELDEEEYNIYLYDEDEVVERANSESGTTLWTNHGQVREK